MDVGEAPLSQFDREVSHDVGGIGTVVSSLPHHIKAKCALCRDVTAHDQQAMVSMMIKFEAYAVLCYLNYCICKIPSWKLDMNGLSKCILIDVTKKKENVFTLMSL